MNGTAEKLLRSLLRQLSFPESHCAPELEELYEDCKKKQDIPSLPQLVQVFEKIINSFEDCYIILDALNEASEYHDLWKIFLGLSAGVVQNAHLLVLSRKGLDLEPIKPSVIPIELTAVNADIRHYVKEQLRTDPRLAQAQSIRPDIEDTVMKNIGGM